MHLSSCSPTRAIKLLCTCETGFVTPAGEVLVWMLFRLTSGKVVSSECTITNVDAGHSSMTSCCFILFSAVISVRLWSCVKLHVQSKILGQQCRFCKYAWFVVCHDVRASRYSESDLCVMKRSQLVLTLSVSFCTDMILPVWPQTIVSRHPFEFLSLMNCIIENSFNNLIKVRDTWSFWLCFLQITFLGSKKVCYIF